MKSMFYQIHLARGLFDVGAVLYPLAIEGEQVAHLGGAILRIRCGPTAAFVA